MAKIHRFGKADQATINTITKHALKLITNMSIEHATRVEDTFEMRDEVIKELARLTKVE